MKPNPIPANYPQVCASIAVNDGSAALDFYQRAFGAEVRSCMKEPGGKIGHAEIQVGTGLFMLADKYDGFNHTPVELGGSTVVIHLYVEDVDAFVARAVEAGAKLAMPIQDQFYGDRSGRIVDPFGHVWLVSSHIEDVSPEEMERRMAAWATSAGA